MTQICSKCQNALTQGLQRWCQPCRLEARKLVALRPEWLAKTQKLCNWCGEVKPVEAFHKNKLTRDGRQSHCKVCYKLKYQPEKLRRQHYAYHTTSEAWKSHAIRTARKRAKQLSLPCTLTPADISIPETCPVLGIPLQTNNKGMSKSSPTLDRKNPVLGYVPENVIVISWHANKLKGNETDPKIFECIAAYLRFIQEQQQ